VAHRRKAVASGVASGFLDPESLKAVWGRAHFRADCVTN
jgi:hypothetical protein